MDGSAKAKAWVLKGPGRIELEEFDVVEPAGDQILVKIKCTSVCASDPKIVQGHSPFLAFPIVPGHEISGEIAAIGSRATASYGLKEGDRITLEPTIPCGHCRWCRGEFTYHKCRPLNAYGVTMTSVNPPHLFGGYGEYLYVLPGSLVYKLDEGVSHLAAALSSVVGNGVRWAKNLGQMEYGQRLVISGAGSQGLATLMAARERGVGPIAMLGLTRDRRRLELAQEFGADFTIDVETEEPLEAVPDILRGPPDAVVETSGVPQAILTALNLVRPLGRVVVIGLSGNRPTPIVFDPLIAKGVTILMDHAQAGNYPDAMRIINSGKYAIEKINNFTYPLEELPRALEDTAKPPEGFIKGAIVFDETRR